MKKQIFFSLLCCFYFAQFLVAQEKKGESEPDGWKIKAALGFDLAQLIFINPRVGAGENRLGLATFASIDLRQKIKRFSWTVKSSLNFGIQRLGRGPNVAFQKSIDEFRINTHAELQLEEGKDFSYAMDLFFLSQISPTYEGNYLEYRDVPNATIKHPMAQFLSPFTFTASPGLAYKPAKGKLVGLNILFSPASLKIVGVGSDSIAVLGNSAGTWSLHGNPYGHFASEEDFKAEWKVKPRGISPDSAYYSKMALQLGATLKASYAGKFLKYKEKNNKDEKTKDRYRIGFATSLSLYSNYLRNPQFIDVEWIVQADFFIVKGLSISIGTNLFYDHDVLVMIDEDKDLSTGVNGYEETGRRVSFTESFLLKYTFLF